MLGCADVQELLEKRSITVGGETTKIELSPQQALLSRDAVVKIVYARLFGFVVSYDSPISLEAPPLPVPLPVPVPLPLPLTR